MKKYKFFIIIFILQINVFTLAQKPETANKVLMKSISDIYVGKEKEGLAHGEGVAKGTDIFSGDFKNGLPDGFGKYTWANGNYYEGAWKKGMKHGKGKLYNSLERKTISSTWKNDVINEKNIKPYSVLRASSVKHVGADKRIELSPGTIKFRFKVSPNAQYYNSLEMSSNSGYVVKTPSDISFRDVTYPFKAEIKFEISGKEFVIHKRCIVEFEIYEAGPWLVTITE